MDFVTNAIFNKDNTDASPSNGIGLSVIDQVPFRSE